MFGEDDFRRVTGKGEDVQSQMKMGDVVSI